MLHCFPTTDVHLLTTAPRNLPINLFLFAKWPPDAANEVWTDLSTIPNINVGLSVISGAGGLFTVTSHLTGAAAPIGPAYTITPLATGTRMAQTTVAHAGTAIDPGDQMRPIRITVHTDVLRFWIAVPAITMFADETNWILPLTAIFDDQSQADVTGHPYFTYASSAPAVADVDFDGRVRAKTAGTATITVTLDGTAQTQSIVLTVLPELAAGHTAKVLQDGTVTGNRTRIYVLAEGYVDPARFEDHFKRTVNRWFTTENSPFDLLRHRYAVFGISDMVPTRGITVGPPLDAQAPSEPLTPTAATIAGPLRIVDEGNTRFGMMYGGRIGDPQTRRGLPATVDRFLAPARAHRAIGVDWRRLPDVHTDPQTTFLAFVRRYLAAVAQNATGMPAGFGDLGPDDRVVVLCDDQLRGGQLLAVAGMEQLDRLVVTAAAGSNAGFSNVTADPAEPRRFTRASSFLFLASPVASTVAHEMAHSYRLGDEYEQNRGRPAAAQLARLERFENLQGLDEIADPTTGGITSRAIKWRLPRMLKAAWALTGVSTGTRIALAIPGADKLAWITVGANLMLRATLRMPRPGRGLPRVFLNEVTVDSVSPTSVIVTSVTGVPQNEVDAGAVLYKPMLDAANRPVRLTLDAVEADLGTNGVYPKPAVRVAGANPGPCFDQDPAAWNETVNPRAITGGPTTPDRFRIIGVHEGGDDISCGIARPTGRCKLRLAFDFNRRVNAPVPFCHVCQYVLVELIDPNVHERLDRSFPA